MATPQHFRHQTREFKNHLQRSDVTGVPRSSGHSVLAPIYSISMIRVSSGAYVLPRCYAACVCLLQEKINTKTLSL